MRFRENPNFENELRRDPRNHDVVKEAADDTAADANRKIREMFRPAVMTPFMPKGGYRGAGGKRPVKTLQDGEAIYVSNLDHGGHLIEWGSINNPPFAPLRRAARAHSRFVE